MFNFLHKLVSGLYFTKPSVHYFQPKSININFKNSIDDKFIWLNLEKYSFIQPCVEQLKENDNNFFILKLVVQTKESYKEAIDLAKFETRKEAETALMILTNKMFSPEKSLIKFSLVAFSLIMLWGVMADMSYVLTRRMFTPSSNQAMTQSVPTQNVNPILSAEEQARMFAELQKQAGAQQAPVAPVAAPIQDPPQNPAIQNIIDGLGKK